jgi:hypothetical protein
MNDVMVNSEELIGAAEYLMLQMRCHINRCCYNQAPRYIIVLMHEFQQPELLTHNRLVCVD